MAKGKEVTPVFVIKTPKSVLDPEFLCRAIDPAYPPMRWGWFHRPEWPLQLGCFRTSSGIRLFLPVDAWKDPLKGWAAFIRVVGSVGLQVRSRDLKVNSEDEHQHTVMYVLQDYAKRNREYNSRHFRIHADLVLKGQRGSSVLPAGLGGGHKGWTVNHLIDVGRHECQSDSRARNVRLYVSAGLHAAAMKAPNKSTPRTKSKRLLAIRAALYQDLPAPSEKRRRETLRHTAFSLYEEHFHAGAKNHNGKSTQEWLDWHSGSHSSLPSTIERKLIAATSCSKDEARWAIIDLAWESFAHVGRTSSAAMQYWLRLASEEARREGNPLNPREKYLFELIYIGVPETGGLPLAVLHDRLDLLEPWLVATVNDRNCKPNWKVFYTMLGFYAHMASCRRTLDNNRKQAPKLRGGGSTGALAVHAKSAANAAETLAALAEKICDRKGIKCQCKTPNWTVVATVRAKAGQRFTVCCSACDTSQHVLVPKKVFDELQGELSA